MHNLKIVNKFYLKLLTLYFFFRNFAAIQIATVRLKKLYCVAFKGKRNYKTK